MNTLVLKRTPWERFKKGLFKYWEYYLMLIPGFALLIIFSYAPMYGIMLAFKNLRMKKGIWGSPWANPWYLHFKTFFDSPYAYRLLCNTLIISITKVVLAKLAAVGLALLLNECHTSWYRRMVQTVSYMPHFLSWVVIYGITYLLCSESSGYINRVLRYFDSPTVSILTSNSAFRPMLYITHIWKGTGFSSIIFPIAACILETSRTCSAPDAISPSRTGRFPQPASWAPARCWDRRSARPPQSR